MRVYLPTVSAADTLPSSEIYTDAIYADIFLNTNSDL